MSKLGGELDLNKIPGMYVMSKKQRSSLKRYEEFKRLRKKHGLHIYTDRLRNGVTLKFSSWKIPPDLEHRFAALADKVHEFPSQSFRNARAKEDRPIVTRYFFYGIKKRGK